MDLKGILSISGYPGLYKHISQARNGIIVEALEGKKRMPAYATSKISALEDIAIFTEGEDIHLVDVLKRIFDKQEGKQAISHKSSPNELKAYFEEVLPEYDKDRVYVSDIKRVLNWYNILQKLEMLNFEEEEEKSEEENKEEETKAEETQVEKAQVEETKVDKTQVEKTSETETKKD